METSTSYPSSVCLSGCTVDSSYANHISINWKSARRSLSPSSNIEKDEEAVVGIKYNEIKDNDKLKRQVLVSLCKCLMLWGAPCHRIEQSLDQAADMLGLEAAFFFIPGIMMICFSDLEPQTLLVRCPQGFDMGKLAQVTEVANDICKEEKSNTSIQECVERLDAIARAPPTWNPWVVVIADTVTSLFTAPVMFNGSWLDTAASGALGLMVGMLSLLAEKYASYGSVFEISSSVIIALVGKALDPWICFTGVVLSATATLLPGYILTMSIMELSAKHVITGTIRFVYALIYALFIGYGLELGTRIYNAIDPTAPSIDFDTCDGDMPRWLYLVMFPFVAIGMATTLGATVDQWLPMTCCSAVGYGTTMIASKVITASNFQVVGMISAFAVGLFGNLYLKVTGGLALVPLSCGIVLLVPGSVGVQGAYFLIRQDDQGASFAIQMVVASLGIAIGLFAGTLLVYPNGKRRWVYLSY